jgi:hypothetical protein
MHYILIEYVKNYGPIKTNISAILIVNEGHTERLDFDCKPATN